MIIIEDSREQKPLTFRSKHIDYVMKSKLEYGDYAAVMKNGEKIPVVFERKSLADLFGTLGKGHTRFKKELERAQSDDVMIVILIEASYVDVVKGYHRSKMKGHVVMDILCTYMVKHAVPFICTGSRRDSQILITNFFKAWSKQYGDKK